MAPLVFLVFIASVFVDVTKTLFKEFVFEIVVDKKLVPKEVLETGGKIRKCVTFKYLDFSKWVKIPPDPSSKTPDQANWSLWSCLPGIPSELLLPRSYISDSQDAAIDCLPSFSS